MSLPVEGSLNYFSILVLIIFSLIVTGAMVGINKLLGRRAKENTHKKRETYESGVKGVGDAHQQFSVRYYLIGIIFLVFDVEVVFMYPWTLVYHTYLKWSAHPFGKWPFFVLLLGGYLYLRLRGAFSWD